MPLQLAMYPLPAAASLSDACEAAASQLLSDVVFINAVVTLPFGSSSTLLSLPLLDSAVRRPFYSFGSAFMYQNGLEQAAALLKSLAQNHAFEDGNKRTAITACLFFLYRCGYWTHSEGLLTAKEAQGRSGESNAANWRITGRHRDSSIGQRTSRHTEVIEESPPAQISSPFASISRNIGALRR